MPSSIEPHSIAPVEPNAVAGSGDTEGGMAVFGTAGPWAVVSVGNAVDDFERRVLAILAQQDFQPLEDLLREILLMRSTTDRPVSQVLRSIKSSCSMLDVPSECQEAKAVQMRLQDAMQRYALDMWDEWWDCRDGRMLRRPLAECLLNLTLKMGEMLTESRCDLLRRVVAARARERMDRRFSAGSAATLQSPYEEWQAQLGDWKGLLDPFPWTLVRSQVMSRTLAYAQLQEPLTQHVKLVRSYEFLRCLGSDLLVDEGNEEKALKLLADHSKCYGCWEEGEVDKGVLEKYLREVVYTDGMPDDLVAEEGGLGVLVLGFSPIAVKGTRIPAALLAHLMLNLTMKVGGEFYDFCEAHALQSTQQAYEALIELAHEISDQPNQQDLERGDRAESIRVFLVAVAEDFLRRRSSRGVLVACNFGGLAESDERFRTVQALEEMAEPNRLLDDMALWELENVLNLVVEAAEQRQRPTNSDIQYWHKRLAESGSASLHPKEIGSLSAALHDFFQHSSRARKEGEPDALHQCALRVLGSQRQTDQNQPGEAISSKYLTPPVGAPRRIVACFGTTGGAASNEGACPSPVVLRAVPLRLCGASDDYEVREVGVRIGGMYRMVSQDDNSSDDLAAGGVVAVHYEWVPPGQVREDSKPLGQVLAGSTHVRILLGDGDVPESREVDLQTNVVQSDSTAYRAIPSRARVSADVQGGFRRFVLEVGRGLRLPLPSGLLEGVSGAGVIETADVLAQVLELWFSQRHSRDDLATALHQRPALLYFASTALFESLDHLTPRFFEALERHWATVLGLQGEHISRPPRFSVVQLEAREILLKLLVAGPEGQLSAVLPSAHLGEFLSLVETTRHSAVFVAVERFCFESAVEKISAYRDSTVTFIIVDVTGQLSAAQLGELVRQACGSVRLVFSWYHGLIASLSVTRSLCKVIVPASIETDINTQVSPIAYSGRFALGQATAAFSRRMAAEPAVLSPLAGAKVQREGLDPTVSTGAGPGRICWQRSLAELQKHMRKAHSWAERELSWRRSVPSDGQAKPSETLLLLVTADEALVRRHYETQPAAAGVRCFSMHHSDRQALAQVEALLNCTTTCIGGFEAPAAAASQTTIVLFSVGFVAPSKLEDLVARAYLGSHRVVLVVQEAVASLRSIRVSTRHATQYVHATVVHVRGVVEAQEVQGPGSVGLRALRLVLGQDAIPCERHGPLRRALEAEDVEASIELLQPALRSDLSGDLLAGILQTVSSTPGCTVVYSDARVLPFAIGCLAASFVLRCNELGLDAAVWEVSFPDFRAHVPVCRFLDMVSVVEAWCRYLDFVGVTSMPSPMAPSAVLAKQGGLHDGPVQWPKGHADAHFLLSQWVLTSNSHMVGLEDLLEHSAPCEDSFALGAIPPAPTYYGTGPGHSSAAYEEVLERHCLRRSELDWAHFSEAWRTALDLKPDVFLQLAAFGVDTLRLFLCLPPERAIELGLTHLLDASASAGGSATPQADCAAAVVQNLLRDVECCGALLETVALSQKQQQRQEPDEEGEAAAGEVAARLAGVKWLLLTVLPEEQATRMLAGAARIDEATIEQLVRAKVMLCPRGRNELLRRVVAIVLGLDGSDVLGSQHDLKKYLLETKVPLPSLLRNPEARVGRAVVSFLFSSDHTEQLKKGEVGCTLVESFVRMFGYNVLRWRELDDPKALEAAEPHRISAAAHTAVLERAPSPEVAQALAAGPLLAAVGRLTKLESAQAADAFLSAVLDGLPPGSDALLLAVLQKLAGRDPVVTEVMGPLGTRHGGGSGRGGPLAAVRNPLLSELFGALRARNLSGYLSMVAVHLDEDGSRPLQLALDCYPELQSSYVEHFRKVLTGLTNEVATAVHSAVLDDSSCAALFNFLSMKEQEAQAQSSDMLLLWYCWGRSPDKQLPVWAFPGAHGGSFALALDGHRPFVDNCRSIGAGLSVLAKYLVSPETLPLGVYNTLAAQVPWAHSTEGSAIEVTTILLGQEDIEEYPPYCLRWHARALPPAHRERLLRKCAGTVGRLRDSSHHFYPQVASGVSEQIFRRNLGMLCSLSPDNSDLSLYFEIGQESQRQFVAACLMCWFKAGGFQFEDLKSCMQAAEQERFSEIWHELLATLCRNGPTSIRKQYVRGPLPTAVDVRWVEEGQSAAPIFARTRDSAQLTAQWLNMLIVHFDIDTVTPFRPEDLVQELGHGAGLRSGPRFAGALDGIARAIGSALRRDLADSDEGARLIESLSGDKYDTQRLVTRLAVVSDFIALLRSTPDNVEQFFRGMVASLASAGDKLPTDVQFAAVFDTFFLLHSITPETDGVEVEELARQYHACGLKISRQAREEVHWQHENYYAKRDRSTGTCHVRFPVFERLCERLHYIRASFRQDQDTILFRRHFARTIFVGDLLSQDHGLQGPPYMKQLHFRLLCESSGASGATAAAAGRYEDEAGGGPSPEMQFTDLDSEFFIATSGEKSSKRETSMHRQWDRPEPIEAAWQDRCPVVSAPEIVEIDVSDTLYLHAVLRLRAGLQPILWRADSKEGFYRFTDLINQRDGACTLGEICKAFETNAGAWRFIDQAHSAVVMCDGFYLRKADDGSSWLVILPSAKPPNEPPLAIGDLALRSRRHCIWPLCHSYKLVNLRFTAETLRVLQLLVWIAWHMSVKGATVDTLPPNFVPTDVVEPLRQLSTLSNYVERTLSSIQTLPESDTGLVKSMQQLSCYQRFERQLAETLLRIMSKVKSQCRDDLAGLIVSESRKRSWTMQPPFVGKDGHTLSSIGRLLQRLLVPLVSKAGIHGLPATTKPWTQLEVTLEACYRGESLEQERCFAKHMHITKSSFAVRGADVLHRLYSSKLEVRRAPTVQHFSDSEDEQESAKQLGAGAASCDAAAASTATVQYLEARSDRHYIDTLMDRDAVGGATLFDQQDGFGRPLCSRNCVVTFYDEDLPLHYIPLNRERLKIQYSASEGMNLGFLLHKNVIAEILEDAKQCHEEDGLKMVRQLRNQLLQWLADVLRSPLANETKTWILRCCERMGMVAVAPYQEANHVNLAVIAYCLCRCCPAGTEAVLFLRSVLMHAWHIPDSIRVFIERKSDVYGIYVVSPGTLQKMREAGLQVAVRDFEREVWQRSMNASSMYLDIISHFSSYCCFVYVLGLSKVDDILLKWLAEYTRLHPWRFVFLEGIDTSFNFPENRDRCNFRFAPPNPLHSISFCDDLRTPAVAEVRPSHTIPYHGHLQPAPEDVQDPRRLFAFFARHFGQEGGSAGATSLFSSPPAPSLQSPDFREELERYLFSADPCLVLLVSAPGAGKTHHVSELRGHLESEWLKDIHDFDGSSDILVTSALAEVLQRTISTQSTGGTQKLLILDEYHMLSDEHKDELFEWVRAKIGPTLSVVLIGNRIDSKDRERLERARPGAGGPALNVGLILTRISRRRIEMVMEARGNAAAWRQKVCDFLVASRFIFGEESVSLRLCDTLEEVLQRPDPRLALIELLLHRVPTISRSTATEFVAAYLEHIGLRRSGTRGIGLVDLCFRIAMLNGLEDEHCSFTEFLERTPKAQEAPPAVRLLAWCTYMLHACDHWDLNLAGVWARRRVFVDQVNFPFELGEEQLGISCDSGPAFSWAGDPTSLRDLVDAVKRGYSVDWAEVYRKVWSVEHVKDSELFAQLLSSSRNPASILRQVVPSNLCSLLRLSNTAPSTAVQLARIILQHAPQLSENYSSLDRPRPLSLWTLLLHDRLLNEVADLLRLAGGTAALLESMLWARDWAMDRRCTAAPQAARTKLLQQALALLCVQEEVPVRMQQVALMWTGSFGRLLRTPTVAQERQWQNNLGAAIGTSLSGSLISRSGLPPVLPLARLREVLEQVADVQDDWPLDVQALWRVRHSRSTARELSALWAASPHLVLEAEPPASSGNRSTGKPPPVCTQYVRGIVAAPGTLHRGLQRALLCHGCHVPEGVTAAAFVASCADALNEMRNANQLKSLSVRGPMGEAVVQLVQKELGC